ncbi:MAG: hypothetical protein HY906_15700 [Deltaproteobacteria bacterium]|nr:hypothetical protein [Deltaproteobacteria bacterium]
MRHQRQLYLVLAAPVALACGLSTMESGGVDGTGTVTPSPVPAATPIVQNTFDAGANACEGPLTRSCTTSCGTPGTQRCNGTEWEPCDEPTELCANGIDDDCDGKVDRADPECPPIVHTCEETEGHNCNADPGYGDKCAAAFNTNGCSAARFWAWCNRRNPAYPDIWDNWIVTWVDSRCDGAVTHDNAQYMTYSCLSSGNDRYECTTPLVLQFGGGAVRFEAGPGAFAFTPGQPVQTDWPALDAPWLVRDVDGDGRILSGRELFGGDTLLPGGRTARHGFEALAALDENDDGAVDARDAAFLSLSTWRDLNGDRVAQKQELQTLAAEGVLSLGVGYRLEPRCDGRRNCERERGTFTFRDGAAVRTGAVVDVYLRVGPLKTEPLACR